MSGTTITVQPGGEPADVSNRWVLVRTCAAEWIRLWTVRSTWWLLAAATAVMLGLGTALGFEAAADPPQLHGQPAWTTARYVAMAALFALLGLALTAVTSDHATGGIVPALQWTPNRTILFLARTIVTVGAATGLGTLLAAACALAAFTTAGSALTLQIDDGVGMLATVAIVFAAGTGLAAGLGFLLRNTAAALIATFLIVLVLPLLLPVFGHWTLALAKGLPGSGAILLLFQQESGMLSGMTTTSSVVVMLAWAVGALLLGWLRLTRDDAHR